MSQHSDYWGRTWQQSVRTIGIEKLETKSQKIFVCHYHHGWCCLDPGAEDEELTWVGPGASLLQGCQGRVRTVLPSEKWMEELDGGRKDIEPVSCPPWEMALVSTHSSGHAAGHRRVSVANWQSAKLQSAQSFSSWSQMLPAMVWSVSSSDNYRDESGESEVGTFGTRSKPRRRKYNRIQDRQ